MSDEDACCAHLKISYGTDQHVDGTVSGYWACEECGCNFVPEEHAKWLVECLGRIKKTVDILDNSLIVKLYK